jgi:hypothetical protein
MINVTARYGLSNELNKAFPEGTTMGQVLSNPGVMGALDFGSNVVGKIDGSTMEMSYVLRDGDEIDVEVRANTKATQPALELVAA